MEDRLQAVRMKLENEIAEVRHELEVDLPLRIEEARKKAICLKMLNMKQQKNIRAT